jgi:rubrerythrin
MEEKLRRFHQGIHSRTVDRDLYGLLTGIVKAEESHKLALMKLLEKLNERKQAGGIVEPPPVFDPDLMKGGIDVAAFMHRNERYLQSVSSLP